VERFWTKTLQTERRPGTLALEHPARRQTRRKVPADAKARGAGAAGAGQQEL
jgi:hypothetical protein